MPEGLDAPQPKQWLAGLGSSLRMLDIAFFDFSFVKKHGSKIRHYQIAEWLWKRSPSESGPYKARNNRLR
jgi:hypothetical protein